MLYYLIQRGNREYDKISLLKLVFFADRYHLRKYATSISNDTYYAMKHGAVASNVKDILDLNFESEEEEKYFWYHLKTEKIKKNENNISTYKINQKIEKLEMLSQTEQEALDFALKNFGNKETFELANLTHEYPEWSKFEEVLKNGFTRQKMNIEDFFLPSKDDKDPYNIIPQDLVNMSRDFYLGKF